MNNNLNAIMGSLSGLSFEELNKVIEDAQKRQKDIKSEKKRAAAANLVVAFNAYKKAAGEEEVIIQNCPGRNFDNFFESIDACIRIDDLYLDNQGNICHKILY